MRFIAVFAVALATALFSMGGTAAAAAMPTEHSAFVSDVLLANEGSIFNPQQASTTTENDTKQVAETPEKDVTEKKKAKETAKTPAPITITVKQGDSLSKIAKANNTTWKRIYDANKSLGNPDAITAGMKLRIPRADEKLASRALPQATTAKKTTSSSTASRRTTQTSTASYPVSSNAAKAFIYARESGNNPNATNPNGCYGIGQDCNGVVRNLCGADYACQDAYFTRYAMGRYGSWEAAYAFWQANHWW